MAYCPELEIPAENAGEINITYPGVTSLENLPKNSLSPGGLGGEKHRNVPMTHPNGVRISGIDPRSKLTPVVKNDQPSRQAKSYLMTTKHGAPAPTEKLCC